MRHQQLVRQHEEARKFLKQLEEAKASGMAIASQQARVLDLSRRADQEGARQARIGRRGEDQRVKLHATLQDTKGIAAGVA